jgi:glyoxylate reductase
MPENRYSSYGQKKNMRPRIYITQPVATSAIERLQQVADVDWNRDALHIVTKAELVEAARTHDVIFVLLHDRVDREVIAANPKLKMIASLTITPADIDIPAATEHRIPVTTVPSPLLDDSTADLAWALLLSVGRRVAEGDRLIRSGIIPGSQSSYLEGGGLTHRTLGILGMGGVGRAAARRAAGFSMKLVYHDPRRLPDEEERKLGATWVPFDELFRQSDFVSLHVALNPKTRHLVGARELALMKPTAYFVNTARGPIVDQEALIEALEAKRIAGAGLDVYEHEPDIDPRLVALPNVVMTPHTGSADRQLRAAMANVAVDNILAVLDGRMPPNCWNRDIYAKR